ncbi:MAG: tRNA (adenosine(37)-N6)-threonylcarbamoyltransferase complex transferase subunit TsaD [Eubacteriaceae bacterium]|nr:tRNA (adenosine(37)-N6)-threonylcarbamoyltransferase complex transferase subunit TsaD [Eubacteriaceae bacterium]
MAIRILAIETSCDETSAAVLIDGGLKSNIVASQVDIHQPYGGVVPEIASRSHIEALPGVIDNALAEADTRLGDVDAVAVTYGPGLVGALLVGLSYAKSLAFGTNTKFIGVNHLAGHIAANYLCGAIPPFVCLIASGGHTSIVNVKSALEFEVMGQTLDDAAGEAFDKIARSLGLGYPGGPKLDLLADGGDSTAINLPKALSIEGNYNFSFSGVKSSVLNYLNSMSMKGLEINKADVAASLRLSIAQTLVTKTLAAAGSIGSSHIAVCGGVASNSLVRELFSLECAKAGLALTIPPPMLCSDNAGMIAAQAYQIFLDGRFSDLSLNAAPSLGL